MIVDLLIPQDAGHFTSYADAFIEALPALVGPVEFRAPRGTLLAGISDNSSQSIHSFVQGGETDADIVVLMAANREMLGLATRRQYRGILIGQDFRSPQAIFRVPSRVGTKFSAPLRGVAGLSLREAAVRRHPNFYLCVVSPYATTIGSSLLRSRTVFTRELGLSATPVRRPARERKRLTLFGVQRPSKGLPLLVSALKDIPEIVNGQYLITIAGPSAPGYERVRDRLVTEIRELGVDLENVDRMISTEHACSLLDDSVTVLPYVSDFGFSAVLGTCFERSTPVVASDFGWLGEIARAAGIPTFANGSACSLAGTLRRVLPGVVTPPDPNAYHRAFASPAAFTSDVFTPITGGTC